MKRETFPSLLLNGMPCFSGAYRQQPFCLLEGIRLLKCVKEGVEFEITYKKVVASECEHCKAVFWQKRPWARFCSTTCRVLSAYHKKRIRRCIQPMKPGVGI